MYKKKALKVKTRPICKRNEANTISRKEQEAFVLSLGMIVFPDTQLVLISKRERKRCAFILLSVQLGKSQKCNSLAQFPDKTISSWKVDTADAF